jgi:Vacuolar protein sorting-associated protein 26
MELAIVRREAAGTGTNIYNESETIVKYEVMDGAPVKGELQLVELLKSVWCSCCCKYELHAASRLRVETLSRLVLKQVSEALCDGSCVVYYHSTLYWPKLVLTLVSMTHYCL